MSYPKDELPAPEPAVEDAIASRDIDEINKNSPFQPVFFGLDQAEVDAGRGKPGELTTAEREELQRLRREVKPFLDSVIRSVTLIKREIYGEE